MDVITAYRGQGETAFRVFHGNVGPVFVSDFHADIPPRLGPQRRNALLHMGLSMYDSEDGARAKTHEFDGKLGDQIAVIDLRGHLGIVWAQTFAPGHMTVWGRPDALEECIREVRPV